MTPEKVRKCLLMLHELSPSSLPVWVLNCWPYWPGIFHHLIVFNKHSPFYDLVSEKKLRPPTITKKTHQISPAKPSCIEFPPLPLADQLHADAISLTRHGDLCGPWAPGIHWQSPWISAGTFAALYYSLLPMCLKLPIIELQLCKTLG